MAPFGAAADDSRGVRRGQADGQNAGQDHQKRKEHLGHGGDQRHAARRLHVLRCHGRLDDEEVGAPVAGAKHEAQPHAEADDLDAHGVGRGVGHALPLVHVGHGDGGFEAAPAADITQPNEHQRQEAGNDEEKLQDLVVDGAGESAEKDVEQYDRRRQDDRERKDTLRREAERAEEAVKDMKRLDEPRHGVHRDAGAEDGHHGEGAGVERAGLLVEPHAEKLGDAARLGAVVEGHHEDAHEYHCRNCADAVEVSRLEAVLGAGRAHADDLLRAEIGADEGQAADPGRQRAAGLEEVLAGLHRALEGKADAQDKDEVEQHDQPVNGSKIQHEGLLGLGRVMA